MLSLNCPPQNYAWGRPAERSEVRLAAERAAKANGCASGVALLNAAAAPLPPLLAQVAQLAKNNGTELDESKPYAELWCALLLRGEGRARALLCIHACAHSPQTVERLSDGAC